AMHNGSDILVFLDLTAAYDSVLINRLLCKMVYKGIDKSTIKICESLLTHCSEKIAVNGSTTKPVHMQRGLFQGSLLSPILFDIYIDDLADEINGPNCQHRLPPVLLFADDILLNTDCPVHMQMHLLTVADWCKENGMNINVSKCGTFHKDPLCIDKDSIPVVDVYKYLGVPI